MNKTIVNTEAFLYRYIIRPILFQFDSEAVHEWATDFGEILGNYGIIKNILKNIHRTDSEILQQDINGIEFKTPVGLSAGFDYQAKLTQVMSSIGFGFGTIGTITNSAYGGNPKPMLGRLPKSRSLMVNKGFKNDGVKKIVSKLEKYEFDVPVGISVGRTNSAKLSQKESVSDIVSAFIVLKQSKIKNSYYELNISCPNLYGNVTFYTPKNLNELLKEIKKLRLTKPVFVKMPINETDSKILRMLDIISKYDLAGVIIGNLQKDRKCKEFDPKEVGKYKVGNFSGRPCWVRSSELVKLAYEKFGNALTIIGCGGVFSAEDAYKKIKLGASLVQLVTGLVFEGPQLPAQINFGLADLLRRDGFKNITDARGVDTF
jgi:dihydroorotate dehydrogenase subfamily 2